MWLCLPYKLSQFQDGTVKVADFGLCTRKNEKMVFFDDRRVGGFNTNDTGIKFYI